LFTIKNPTETHEHSSAVNQIEEKKAFEVEPLNFDPSETDDADVSTDSEFIDIEDEFDISHGEIETLVRYHKGQYVVFIDKSTELDWATTDEYDDRINLKYENEKELKTKRAEAMSEIEIIQHKPIIDLLDKSYNKKEVIESSVGNRKKHLIWMLAEAIVYVLDEEYEVAKGHIVKINAFLSERNYEISRKWQMVTSGVATIIIFFVFLSAYFMLKSIATVNELVLTFIKFMPFGALGSTMSIFQRGRKQEHNCESGKTLNIIETIARLSTGMVAAFIALCLFNLEMVFAILRTLEEFLKF
jgi:hypothetical protein